MQRRKVNPLDRAIGERIRQARIKQGISQKELAIALGLNHHVTITSMERGFRCLLAREVKAAADILGVSCQWLLTGWYFS